MTTTERGPIGWRSVLAPWAAAKAVGLLVPLLTVWQSSPASGIPSGAEFRQAFDWWDAPSYISIADHGYPGSVSGPEAHLWGFLPGFPILLHAAGVIIRDPVVAGVLVNCLLELVALLLIARLVAAELDADAGRFAAWSVALWPLAFFLTAIYTESAFLACAAGALLLARRGDLGRASLVAGIGCAVRVTGVALVPALLVEYVRRHGMRPRPALLAVLLVPLPILLFALYGQAHAGDLLAYKDGQAQLGASFGPPWSGARATWDAVVLSSLRASTTYVFLLELCFGIAGFAALLVAIARRRIAVSLWLYCAGVWLLATSLAFWRSVPRYELAMFPLVIVAAQWTRGRPALRAALITAGAGLLAFGASRYAVDMWLG